MFIRSSRPRPATGVVVSLCALALFVPACQQASDPSSAQVEEAHNHPEHTSCDVRAFTTRGKIVTLPDPANPATELQIHHEHIPDFIGWDGQLHINSDGVPGMKAMTMPFDVAFNSMLDGLAVGDKVELTMVMDLAHQLYWIRELTKLEPDTALDYANKVSTDSEGP